MKRYRIVMKKTVWREPNPNEPYSFVQHCYIGFIPQKRFLGFLWWYSMIDNISDINGYETVEEARGVIMKDMFEENEQVVICEY